MFMGTGGAGGPPGRAHNCILVETASKRIILDFGEACSWRLRELGLNLCDIDAVYITHLHVDHFIGLFDASVHAVSEGCRRLRVLVAEPLVADANSVLEKTLPSSIREGLTITGVGLGKPARLGDIELHVAPACHSVECFAVLLQSGGAAVLYTGDTTWNCNGVEALARRARNAVAQLVVHEAALPDHLEEVAARTGHSTPSRAVEASKKILPDAGIALVHFSEASLRQVLRMRSLPSNVIVASDMLALGL